MRLMKPLDPMLAATLLASSLTAATLFPSSQAVAAPSTDRSSVGFTFSQMGVSVDGGFSRVDATMAFDPAKPVAASARVVVHVASIDAGSDEANDMVKEKPWFDAGRFPTARFVSERVQPLGGNRFQVSGTLTLKGRTRPVSAPFTVTRVSGHDVFDGSFAINRLDYGIGEGEWSDIATVANAIRIRFHLVAAPVAAR